MNEAKTLFDKIWDAHVVDVTDDGLSMIYADRLMLMEMQPQAFEGLRIAGLQVRQPGKSLGVVDHVVPTINREQAIADPESRQMIDQARLDYAEFGIELFDIQDPRQGIVHVVGPEQGFTLPGVTLFCGDSHTATNGALGAFAMVVPGSGMVKREAEVRGLHRVFLDAGFEWCEPGCSMCIAMNGDFAQPGQRCASTSNRNFEGRQGRDSRTHLLSPAMAAAAAISGRLSDVRELVLSDP